MGCLSSLTGQGRLWKFCLDSFIYLVKKSIQFNALSFLNTAFLNKYFLVSAAPLACRRSCRRLKRPFAAFSAFEARRTSESVTTTVCETKDFFFLSPQIK